MSDKYQYLVGSEEAQLSASRIESSAADIERHASTISEAVRKLEIMTDPGYGGTFSRLLAVIEDGKLDRLLELLEKPASDTGKAVTT